MIRCPKCNEDNMIGAIFCRSCGVKLELDDLRPSDLKGKKGKSKAQTIVAIIRNFIILIIIGILVGAVIAVFVKPSSTVPEGLNAEQTSAAMGQFKKLHKSGNEGQYTFNLAELHMLAQMVTELTHEQALKTYEDQIASGSVAPLLFEDIYLGLSPPSNVKFIFQCMVLGKLTCYITIVGPLIPGQSGVNYTADRVYIGRLPILVPPLKDFLLEQITTNVKGISDFKEKVLPKITGYTMDPEKITLLRAPAK